MRGLNPLNLLESARNEIISGGKMFRTHGGVVVPHRHGIFVSLCSGRFSSINIALDAMICVS